MKPWRDPPPVTALGPANVSPVPCAPSGSRWRKGRTVERRRPAKTTAAESPTFGRTPSCSLTIARGRGVDPRKSAVDSAVERQHPRRIPWRRSPSCTMVRTTGPGGTLRATGRVESSPPGEATTAARASRGTTSTFIRSVHPLDQLGQLVSSFRATPPGRPRCALFRRPHRATRGSAGRTFAMERAVRYFRPSYIDGRRRQEWWRASAAGGPSRAVRP